LNSLYKALAKVENADDLVSFIKALEEDFQHDKDKWENWTVPDYLDAMAAWIRDWSSSPENDIDWNKADLKTIARILYMGKYYE